MSSSVVLEKRKKINLKALLIDKLKMLIFILIMGSLASALLTTLDDYTKVLEERNVELFFHGKVLSALNLDDGSRDVAEAFQANITIEQIDGRTLYRDSSGAIAFKFSGGGLWGPISGIVALNPDLTIIEGLAILEQQETPGLGGRIAEDEFLQRFRGVSVDPELVILPARRSAVNPNEVDGITGASMTGDFLSDMINKAIKEVRDQLGVS